MVVETENTILINNTDNQQQQINNNTETENTNSTTASTTELNTTANTNANLTERKKERVKTNCLNLGTLKVKKNSDGLNIKWVAGESLKKYYKSLNLKKTTNLFNMGLESEFYTIDNQNLIMGDINGSLIRREYGDAVYLNEAIIRVEKFDITIKDLYTKEEILKAQEIFIESVRNFYINYIKRFEIVAKINVKEKVF